MRYITSLALTICYLWGTYLVPAACEGVRGAEPVEEQRATFYDDGEEEMPTTPQEDLLTDLGANSLLDTPGARMLQTVSMLGEATEQSNLTVDETLQLSLTGCASSVFQTDAAGTGDVNSRVQLLEYSTVTPGTIIDCVLSCTEGARNVFFQGATAASKDDSVVNQVTADASDCPVSIGLKSTSTLIFFAAASAENGLVDATITCYANSCNGFAGARQQGVVDRAAGFFRGILGWGH